MSAYTEIEKMILDFNTKVLSLAQQNYDLKTENERLNRLVEAYKAKSDLLIERVRPVDMHLTKEDELFPGDEEILKEEESRGLKLIK